MIGTMLFGRISEKMIRAFPSPIERRGLDVLLFALL